MSSLLRPVGPHPPSVYWVRRGLSLAALVIVIALIAWACGHSSSSPSGQGSPHASATPATSGPVRCAAPNVTLTVTTDAVSYPVGQTPRLIGRLTNAGSSTCVLRLAPATEIWQIVSGPDTVFSTKRCPQSTAQSRDIRLAPNKSKQVSLLWNGKRLGYDQPTKHCVAGSTPVPPGTYQLSAKVAGIKTTKPAVFHIAGTAG